MHMYICVFHICVHIISIYNTVHYNIIYIQIYMYICMYRQMMLFRHGSRADQHSSGKSKDGVST